MLRNLILFLLLQTRKHVARMNRNLTNLSWTRLLCRYAYVDYNKITGVVVGAKPVRILDNQILSSLPLVRSRAFYSVHSRCCRQGYGNRCTYSKRRPHQFPPMSRRQHGQIIPTGMTAADGFLHSTSPALACGMLPLKRYKPT